jgi:hypothetical protein
MEIAGAEISECHNLLSASGWAHRKSPPLPDSLLLQTWKLRTHFASSTIRMPLHIPQPHLREN